MTSSTATAAPRPVRCAPRSCGALPEHLDAGGFASVLASWPVTDPWCVGAAELDRCGQPGVAAAGAHRRSVAARAAMEPAGWPTPATWSGSRLRSIGGCRTWPSTVSIGSVTARCWCSSTPATPTVIRADHGACRQRQRERAHRARLRRVRCTCRRRTRGPRPATSRPSIASSARALRRWWLACWRSAAHADRGRRDRGEPRSADDRDPAARDERGDGRGGRRCGRSSKPGSIRSKWTTSSPRRPQWCAS